MTTSRENAIFARDELDLIVAFAGCSLDEKPGSNWVEHAGSLPDYVCRIAKAVRKTGKTTSQAIAIAIDRVKVWASGKGVDKDTQAKAAKALAEWEALKAKNKARKAKKVAASNTWQGDILVLSDSVSTFNTEVVRRAWRQQTSAWRNKYQQMYPAGGAEPAPTYSFIRELWTDHLIVEAETSGDEALFRVDYEVDADGNVTFGQPVAVEVQYVTVQRDDMVGRQMDDATLRRMVASMPPCNASSTDQVLLSIGSRPSALDLVLSRQVTRPMTATERILAQRTTPALGESSLRNLLTPGTE